MKFSPAVEEFLSRPIHSQLATLNPSGSPQQTVMWHRYENGAFLFTTTVDRVKYRNVQRNPRGSHLVLDPADRHRWVITNGTFSIDDRDPVAFYVALAEHYLGAAELDAWRRNAEPSFPRRTVLRLTPTRVRTDGFPRE